MPHSKTGKEIKIGSIIKGPNVSGVEILGIVHNMRTGQKCSGDAKVLAVIHRLGDTTLVQSPPLGYVNEAFDADAVEVFD